MWLIVRYRISDRRSQKKNNKRVIIQKIRDNNGELDDDEIISLDNEV